MIHKAFAKMITNLSITGVNAVVNGRPPENVDYPFLVIYQAGEISGTQSAYAKKLMRVGIYAESYDECYTIAKELYAIVNNNIDVLYDGVYYRFNNITKENEIMNIEDDCFGLSIDFMISIENQ